MKEACGSRPLQAYEVECFLHVNGKRLACKWWKVFPMGECMCLRGGAFKHEEESFAILKEDKAPRRKHSQN